MGYYIYHKREKKKKRRRGILIKGKTVDKTETPNQASMQMLITRHRHSNKIFHIQVFL